MGREYPRYAFLRLHHGEGFPYLEVTTAITPDGASYYGPFWTMRSAEQALDFVSRLFGLRRCEGDLPPEAEARRCLWGADAPLPSAVLGTRRHVPATPSPWKERRGCSRVR